MVAFGIRFIEKNSEGTPVLLDLAAKEDAEVEESADNSHSRFSSFSNNCSPMSKSARAWEETEVDGIVVYLILHVDSNVTQTICTTARAMVQIAVETIDGSNDNNGSIGSYSFHDCETFRSEDPCESEVV